MGYTLNQHLVKNAADKGGQVLMFVYMQGKKPENNQAMAILLTLNGKYIDPNIEDDRITSVTTISAPPPIISSEDIIGDFSTISVVNSWNIIDESFLIGEECYFED